MTATLGDITAAILAGGRGTRIQSVVSDRPKALAPVLGRPYLAYLLDFLADAGIRNVVLLTGHMAEQIQRRFGHHHAGMRLSYSKEPKALGTGGAVRHALPRIPSSPVLILNGDSFWGISLSDFWAFHTLHRSPFTLGLTRMPDASRFGRVHVQGDQVVRFEEKQPRSEPGWINAGIYLASRERLEEIPPDVPVSLERDLFPRWVKAGQCLGFRSAAPFLDIGTPESYAQAVDFFANRPAA